MTEQETREIKDAARKLEIHIGNKKPETLKAEIEAIHAAEVPELVVTPVAPDIVPEAVETVAPTPEPASAPIDTENPDAGGLAKRQEEASQEARMKALEERLLLAESRADLAEERSKVLESTVAKKPTRDVPERPNPNTMVYFKDIDEKGKEIIKHKQVSFAEAAILLATDTYEKSPAKFK